MKIGIDIDNTITNTLEILKQYCIKYNEEIVKRNLKFNELGWASYNFFEWTAEENEIFCTKYLEEIIMQTKIKENAQDVIKKLKLENEIYIITARDQKFFENIKEKTAEFLKKNQIIYDELVLTTQKDVFCRENNIDFMIEDEQHYIQEISKTIPVIVFQAIYNQNCTGKNIYPVNNWNEVYDIIIKRKEG